MGSQTTTVPGTSASYTPAHNGAMSAGYSATLLIGALQTACQTSPSTPATTSGGSRLSKRRRRRRRGSSTRRRRRTSGRKIMWGCGRRKTMWGCSKKR